MIQSDTGIELTAIWHLDRVDRGNEEHSSLWLIYVARDVQGKMEESITLTFQPFFQGINHWIHQLQKYIIMWYSLAWYKLV